MRCMRGACRAGLREWTNSAATIWNRGAIKPRTPGPREPERPRRRSVGLGRRIAWASGSVIVHRFTERACARGQGEFRRG